ncbi:hypothetical protein MKW94_015666, partial [Papaver nudicaule]|nr:hypothetical protein [Papaver nudicaule]
MICLLSIVQGRGILGSRSDSSRKLLDDDDDDNVFDVMDFGAVGDGKTDDAKAFLDAWEKTCEATADSPTMVIPEGKTFLLHRLSFDGPCKSENVSVQVSGKIIAPTKSSWDGDKDYWIQFSDVNGLSINGSGSIDGQGSDWWDDEALRLSECDGVNIRGLKHVNSQKNHITITGCGHVNISCITIEASEDSPNTDGIDISHSTNVLIENSSIGTGDDCVAVNGGCFDINITNVACGPGHGI